MAGDWIPVRVWLDRAREVVVISRETRRSPEEIMGFLLKLWFWITEESRNGHAPSVTLDDLVVTLGGDAELWQAVERVGWLSLSSTGLAIPNWERWNSRSAKDRLQGVLRKRAERERNRVAPQDVTDESRSRRDKTVTTEDRGQRTEESKEKERGEELSRTPWQDLLGKWNRIAAAAGVSRVKRWDEKSKRRYRALEAKHADFWESLEREVPKMATKLRAGAWFDFWWILEKEEHYLKLARGNYRESRTDGADVAGRRSTFAEEGKFSDARYK